MAQIHGKQLRDDSVGLAKLNDAGGQSILFGAGTTIGLTDAPTANTDLANKAYVDTLASGLDPKGSVRVATTAVLSGVMTADNVAPTTGNRSYNTTAKTITWFATQGPTTIDGVTLVNGNRILVKNETATSGPSAGEGRIYNGIYERTSLDVWTRASDQDGSPANEVSGGNYTFVETGSTELNKGFVLQGDGVLTLQTDNLIWVQFSSVSALTGGAGIDISSNEINIELDTASGLEFDTAGAAGKLRINSDTVTANTIGLTLTSNGAGIVYDTNFGLTESSESLRINLLSTGGLEFSGGALAVNADGTTGATVAPVSVGTNGVGVTVDNSTITHAAGTLSANFTGAAFIEAAQDAVGAALTDSSTIDFTYNDGANTITAAVITNSIDETHLTASVAGTGISGGNGTALSVDYSIAGASGAAIEASALASSANGEGASMVGIENVNGNFSATNVEEALNELIDSLTTPQSLDKNLVASVTAADEDLATVSTVSDNAVNYIQVYVNGIKVSVGHGAKNRDCYFSADGGTTAKTIANVQAGDELYWMGSIAGYELDATDRIDFEYTFLITA